MNVSIKNETATIDSCLRTTVTTLSMEGHRIEPKRLQLIIDIFYITLGLPAHTPIKNLKVRWSFSVNQFVYIAEGEYGIQITNDATGTVVEMRLISRERTDFMVSANFSDILRNIFLCEVLYTSISSNPDQAMNYLTTGTFKP